MTRRNRKYVIKLLKLSECQDCNNDDWRVLEFDHRDRKDKKFSISSGGSSSIIKLQLEIDKCDIVCSNCHTIRTIKQRGYYENLD